MIKAATETGIDHQKDAVYKLIVYFYLQRHGQKIVRSMDKTHGCVKLFIGDNKARSVYAKADI